MNRSRTAVTLTSLVATALLTLTACGGGGGDDTSQRQATLDGLMAEITADGDITQEQQACMRSGLEGYSDDELTSLQDSGNESEIPLDLQDKVITLVTGCLTPGG